MWFKMVLRVSLVSCLGMKTVPPLGHLLVCPIPGVAYRKTSRSTRAFPHCNLEVVMSFTRWFVFATFTGGLLALSLQGGGVVQAAPIADSPAGGQEGQQKVPSGMRDA